MRVPVPLGAILTGSTFRFIDLPRRILLRCLCGVIELLKTTQRRSGNGLLAAAGILLTLAAAPAHANSYLFSFTAQQLLTALAQPGAQGPTVEQESAYFGIWLKPNLTTYSYTTVWSPNSTSQQAWQANTINDPADLGTGTWAGFNKDYNQAAVAILSDANAGGTPDDNIFMYSNYTGSASPAPPIGWGATQETMVELISSGALFKFMIDTPDTISGPVTVTGKASALISGSTLSMTGGTKDFTGLNFSISGTPQYVPEPSPFVLFLAGAIALFLLSYLRRKKPFSRT
jgi:hypothetical protein